MGLEADAVVWALRAIDGAGVGTSAADVAGFLAKDATLSEDYSADQVHGVLEQLAAEGVVICRTTESRHDAVDEQFRLAAPSSAHLDGSVAYDADDELNDDVFFQMLAPAKDAPGPGHAGVDATAERDALLAERDALVAERDDLVDECAALARERDALVTRADRLEHLLARERAVSADRSASTRRVAAALRKARDQLEAREPAVGRGPSESTSRRRTPRGNWLKP